MSKFSTASITAAAMVLAATSASPAFGQSGIRSGDALPGAARPGQSARFETRTNAMQGFSVHRSPAGSPQNQSALFAGSNGLGSSSRFGELLLGFLPPRAVDALTRIVERGGAGGQALCRIFNLPECGDPDSPG